MPQGRVHLLLKLFFSPVGRIRPGLYWIGLAALSLAGLAVTAAFGLLNPPEPRPPTGDLLLDFLPYMPQAVAAWSTVVLHTPGPGFVVSWTIQGPETTGNFLSAVIVIAFFIMAFCLQAKRLHDAGATAWWVIAFAVFEMVSPIGLGLITRVLYRPGDPQGFVFTVAAYMAVGMLLPLIVKIVIGVLPSRPEANKHGPRPGPRELGLPPGAPALSLLGKRK